MSWTDAVSEIVADHLPHRIDRERVFIDVASLWREFSDREILSKGSEDLPCYGGMVLGVSE